MVRRSTFSLAATVLLFILCLATTVPKPGSVLLLGFGLLAVFLVLRNSLFRLKARLAPTAAIGDNTLGLKGVSRRIRTNGRSLVTVIVAIVFLAIGLQSAGADTYKVPLQTATLVTSNEAYLDLFGPDGSVTPGVPYDLQLNPSSLRVSYGGSTVYETCFLLDWSALPVDRSRVTTLMLHLAPVGGYGVHSYTIMGGFDATSEPTVSDFAWWSRVSGSGLTIFDGSDTSSDMQPVSYNGSSRYSSWVATSVYSAGDFSFAGGDSAYAFIVATPVPEPGFLAVLFVWGAAVFMGVSNWRRRAVFFIPRQRPTPHRSFDIRHYSYHSPRESPAGTFMG